MSLKSKRCLITYYSRRGENYASGRIEHLEKGNTEIIAGMIQRITGGDLFHIETVTPYPAGYNETTEVAKRELRDDARPEIKGVINNIDEYDVVFVGYPNWWGTMPMAVFTFLQGYDLAGKIIIPFCTHEGSGLGRSEQDIKRLCPRSTVLKGIALRGGSVSSAGDDVLRWIEGLGV